MNKKSLKIVLTGGGSGGHIFPLVAVARELKKQTEKNGINTRLVFIGPLMKKDVFENEQLEVRHLITGKLRRYLSWHIITDAFKLMVGFIQSLYYLLNIRPDIVFSKGGYGSFPTVIIARVFNIPVVSHEADTVPGLANKILARFSTQIIVSFPGNYPEFPSSKIVRIGNPVRNMKKNEKESRGELNINSEKPVILILGGSQGAAQINNMVIKILPELTKDYEVIHQAGKHYKEVRSKAMSIVPDNQKNSYKLYEFLNESMMQAAYSVSDIIISRAGAGSIFEFALTGTPSILIPLKKDPGGHQKKNANEYEKAGACIALNTYEVTPKLLLENIRSLVNNQERRESMSKAAKEFARPDAAEKIAKLILDTV